MNVAWQGYVSDSIILTEKKVYSIHNQDQRVRRLYHEAPGEYTGKPYLRKRTTQRIVLDGKHQVEGKIGSSCFEMQ